MQLNTTNNKRQVYGRYLRKLHSIIPSIWPAISLYPSLIGRPYAKVHYQPDKAIYRIYEDSKKTMRTDWFRVATFKSQAVSVQTPV